MNPGGRRTEIQGSQDDQAFCVACEASRLSARRTLVLLLFLVEAHDPARSLRRKSNLRRLDDSPSTALSLVGHRVRRRTWGMFETDEADGTGEERRRVSIRTRKN